MNIGTWNHPALIAENRFIHKSLSDWSLNIAVGCNHACRFCYVPSTSTNKLAPALSKLGVRDPDSQWGDYVFLRNWDENAFLQSLRKAESKPICDLSFDGNRAVMLCTTTDPYQVTSDPEWNDRRAKLVRRALELILTRSTLNVRILTRSPLARQDFDLFRQFGDRLLFGMSLPTLDNALARIYEPKAPAPSQRLKTLQEASAGLNVYVAMAPTYPECSPDDLRRTIEEVAQLNPVTVFHEPINIRADNVARIKDHARSLGMTMQSEVFATTESWRAYALKQLMAVQILALNHGIGSKLHLWPDASLMRGATQEESNWLTTWWSQISDWPGKGSK